MNRTLALSLIALTLTACGNPREHDPAYVKAAGIASSLKCDLPQGIHEQPAAVVFKPYMKGDKDKIAAAMKEYREGTYVAGTPIDQAVDGQARLFKTTCESYIKTNTYHSQAS